MNTKEKNISFFHPFSVFIFVHVFFFVLQTHFCDKETKTFASYDRTQKYLCTKHI